MTPLRQKMIDTMVLKGFSPRTQETYLYAVEKLALHFHRSPDKLDVGDVERYFVYLLREKNLAAASVRVRVNGLRFFYREVMSKPLEHFLVRYPKLPQRIPELLTRSEIQSILSHVENLKHYTMLATCYACGLRVSELVALRVRDIDSAQHVIHVRQGKGNKDRNAILTEGLLRVLRRYWQAYRPADALFYGQLMARPLSYGVPQKVYRKAKAAAGIKKCGGIHSLRHAYATHQLEAGMPVYKLQLVLGHKDVKSTMRYIHWLPHYASNGKLGVDLLMKESES